MNISNYTLIIDNFLNTTECDQLINYYHNSKNKLHINDYRGYVFCKIEDDFKISKKIKHIANLYTEKFPESFYTEDKWGLSELRVKHFRPGFHFSKWHSEHGVSSPFRVLAIQIYLSSHKCGTRFFNNKTIKSKKGRLAVWPAYFTHTHKGEVCPENLDRFIFSGYYSFFK
jgi:hypothetical protein